MSDTITSPEEWTTGLEKMTDKQAEFLKVLCEETGQRFDPKWDKSEASKRIDAMQKQKAEGNTSQDQAQKTSSTGTPPPESHLAHPETWTTGQEAATDKQKAFLAVLNKQHPHDQVPLELTKAEASEAIEKLKHLP